MKGYRPLASPIGGTVRQFGHTCGAGSGRGGAGTGEEAKRPAAAMLQGVRQMKSRESVVRLKRFQVEEKRRQVAQIDSMIAEFNRMSAELDVQINAEQERTGIRDTTHFAYSTFAKAAM